MISYYCAFLFLIAESLGFTAKIYCILNISLFIFCPRWYNFVKLLQGRTEQLSKNNKSSGCGTGFGMFLAACLIALLTEYWKIVVGAAIVVVILVLAYFATKCIDRNVAKTNKRLEEIRKNTFCGEKLSGGIYVTDRDFPAGLYDIRAVKGNGDIRVDSLQKDTHLKNNRLYLSEGQTFRNVELKSQSQVLIPVDMTVDLYNCRELPAQIPDSIPASEVSELPTLRRTFSMEDIDRMDGHDFEYVCADILRAKGYENVTVTRGSGDQGVDVIAEQSGIKYAVQCKRFSGSVGNKAVQEVHFGKTYYHCHVAIVMTNSYFTRSAKDAANESNIILWDRDDLMPYFEEYIKNKNPEQELSSQPLEVEETQNNIVENESEEAIRYSVLPEYDAKSGIYPAGYYAIGKTIPKGGYIFKSRGDDEGVVAIFETSDDLSKEENDVFFHSFTGSYFLALIGDNKFIAIENADAQRVYGVN